MKYKGLAKLAKVITFVSMNGKGPGRPPRGTFSLLWVIFKPSSRTASEKAGWRVQGSRAGSSSSSSSSSSACAKKRPLVGLG